MPSKVSLPKTQDQHLSSIDRLLARRCWGHCNWLAAGLQLQAPTVLLTVQARHLRGHPQPWGRAMTPLPIGHLPYGRRPRVWCFGDCWQAAGVAERGAEWLARRIRPCDEYEIIPCNKKQEVAQLQPELAKAEQLVAEVWHCAQEYERQNTKGQTHVGVLGPKTGLTSRQPVACASSKWCLPDTPMAVHTSKRQCNQGATGCSAIADYWAVGNSAVWVQRCMWSSYTNRRRTWCGMLGVSQVPRNQS